jgi:hypothetical protein
MSQFMKVGVIVLLAIICQMVVHVVGDITGFRDIPQLSRYIPKAQDITDAATQAAQDQQVMLDAVRSMGRGMPIILINVARYSLTVSSLLLLYSGQDLCLLCSCVRDRP